MRVRIDVEATLAKEAHERDARFGGEVDREGRRSGDRGDEANPRRQGFLNDLEGDSPADHEQVPLEGQLRVQKGSADEFVDGVVTADILANGKGGVPPR